MQATSSWPPIALLSANSDDPLTRADGLRSIGRVTEQLELAQRHDRIFEPREIEPNLVAEGELFGRELQ